MKGKVKSQKRKRKVPGAKMERMAPAMKMGAKPKYQEMAVPTMTVSMCYSPLVRRSRPRARTAPA